MKPLLFELCVESLQAALAAQFGGADRIELCVGLAAGGITPPSSLVAATIRAVSIPVSVLIRPRFGHFAFTSDEFDLMRRQIDEARDAGAAAVALGVLHHDRRVDLPRTRALVDRARPMKVTFHRAFDEAPDLSAALNDVIASGADCLLTSGGCPDVLTGAATIARLRQLAGDRLRIMAGGGLRLENLAEVVRQTGVNMLHGSLTRANGTHPPRDRHPAAPDAQLLQADVEEAIRRFHHAFNARTVAASVEQTSA